MTGPAHADPPAASLVEDGAYPGAAAILATQNVRLLAGDGHIIIADCATPPSGGFGVLKVYTTDETIGADGIGRVCFKVNAAAGWLNLEVPGVYEIRGDGQSTGTGHEVTAELTTDTGDQITVDVDPDGSTQVGLGADPDNEPTILLQLRAGDGPAPVAGTQPAIGKLVTADHSCTATLIGREWALTAATCLTPNSAQGTLVDGPPAGDTHLVLPGKTPIAITHLLPRTDRDAVLAKLATPVTDVAALHLSHTTPAIGAVLPGTGYSRTATTWTTDTQQTAATTVTAVTATTLVGTFSGGPVCKGAAGSPVLNANGDVVAIRTHSGQADCFDTTAGTTAVTDTRVDDIAAWTAEQTWTGFDDQAEPWYTPDGWNSSQAKYSAGDFNGDGKTDLAAFFDYDNSSTGLWTWTRNSNGGYDHVKLWQTPEGQLTQPAMTPLTGDFDGDGNIDIAAFYGHVSWMTSLFIWNGNGDGTFGPQTEPWYTPDGWNSSQAKYTAGDFNGDGKTDLAAFFDYDNSSTGLWTWTRNSNGGYDHVKLWQTPEGQLTQPAMTPLTGDFDGDGNIDIAAFYDHVSWMTSLFIWNGNGVGTGRI
ncbi:FG-GAP-like repeat-containing protein [Catellatospora sichuanensis]|uniref:FG-GAP-like repeat-containing protein n=1 Tax=Catellatospora sichuanensis TaxID=1969805 RepID=UPI00164359A7|nr:FG-GAP-like repeat-containing protein [Catellatospora sichuanensis]